jgi:hypothetical protein
LSEGEFKKALQHAAGCANCQQLLITASRPGSAIEAAPPAESGPIGAAGATGPTGAMPAAFGASIDEIQARLEAWRAARRAPLMPAFPWHKGHEVDRYVIIRSVGGTEDGVIYEAFDSEREDRVVVKQLDLRVDDPATPALMTAAHRQTQFSHPNVLQMLSVGVHAGSVYVVYEFVKGTPLSQTGNGDPQQLIELYAQAARGLAAAHDAGIVHGCFSAASCVVGRDGKVRVLDFGIGEARARRARAVKPQLDDDWAAPGDQVSNEDSFVGFIPTRRHPTSGQFESLVLAAGPNSLGPRIYAAPEQVLGAPPSPASDQFALCASLFHRLYGQPPFAGETISLWLRELLHGRVAAPPARPEVPASIQAALLRGLEREPSARFDRMSNLVGKLTRGPLLGRRKRMIAAAIATGAVVAAAGIVVLGSARSQPAGVAELASCDGALASWNTLWGPDRLAALTRASAAGADGDALPALRSRLDGWVGTWRKATHGFCSAPDSAQAPDCTSRARAAAGDLLQLIEGGAPARLARAAAATEALPTVEQCASTAPSPASAPIAVVRADLRRRLGLLDEADQLIAKPSDDPAQRSYQSLVRGHTAADRGDLIEARRLFETAAFEAQAAHQPELGTTAAVQRLALACSAAERALWSGYLASSAAASQPQPPADQAGHRGALAQSLLCEGKAAEAVALRQQVRQALHGETSAAAALAALDLARAQLVHGELAGAEASGRDAAAIYTQIWGSRHPQAQLARLTVAEAQLASPASSAAASAAIERVLAELAERKEPDAVRARALVLQGKIAELHGNASEALRLVQRAGQEYEAALGGTHPELADAQLAAGDLLLGAGRDQEAEASYRQVAAIFDTLGHSESAQLAHARAGIQIARWGARPPADAGDTLHWGLAPTGDAIDPAVAGWLAEQLGRRAAQRGDAAQALVHFRAATAAWQQAGDPRGTASALTESALIAAQLRDPAARLLLEQALQAAGSSAAADKPRLQGALGKLLWSTQRDRARGLIRAALAALPDDSADAADLTHWLKRRDADR